MYKTGTSATSLQSRDENEVNLVYKEVANESVIINVALDVSSLFHLLLVTFWGHEIIADV